MFIEITDSGFKIDDSHFGEDQIVEHIQPLIQKYGYDRKNLSTGVNPGPDFGYYELADRYWRASLCIYFSGITDFFWERGAGYAEPWLYNAIHAIELYIKGFHLSASWYNELQEDPMSFGEKEESDKIKTRHELLGIYQEYKERIKYLSENWREALGEKPNYDRMILNKRCEQILCEVEVTQANSFRFRYPSLLKERLRSKDGNKIEIHELQRLEWRYDDTKLLPLSGLPAEPGYFFDHVKVINSLHELIAQLREISNYHDACWSYISEGQDNFRSGV